MVDVPVSRDEWLAEAVRRFGPDPLQWRFRCPVCGNVQTPGEFKVLKVGLDPQMAYLNCKGRYLDRQRRAFGRNERGAPGSHCDYASGGLLKVGRVVVLDGVEHNVFPFAD